MDWLWHRAPSLPYSVDNTNAVVIQEMKTAHRLTNSQYRPPHTAWRTVSTDRHTACRTVRTDRHTPPDEQSVQTATHRLSNSQYRPPHTACRTVSTDRHTPPVEQSVQTATHLLTNRVGTEQRTNNFRQGSNYHSNCPHSSLSSHKLCEVKSAYCFEPIISPKSYA